MQYSICRHGNRFCIAMAMHCQVELEYFPTVYWNPEKKTFQRYATDCWRKSHKEDEVLAEFFRINFLKEGTGIIL